MSHEGMITISEATYECIEEFVTVEPNGYRQR